MKHKIAVYGNGWNLEALQHALVGIRKYASLADFDVYVFLSYASYSVYSGINQGQLNIYELCDITSFDGIIVFSTLLNSPSTAVDLCHRAKELGIPVVSVGMEIEGIPTILVQNRDGMADLVTHLVEEHNIKRVIFMGGTPDHVDSQERLAVTKEILEKHGIPLPPENIVYGNWNNANAGALVRQMIASKEGLPDAIICANDIMALGASSELIRQGYSLPEDIIITGYDQLSAGSTFYPSLTTVTPAFTNVGYRSCELLFDQLNGKGCDPVIKLPSVFIRGESCGCSGGSDYIKIRQKYCQDIYQKHIQYSLLEERERVLSMRITDLTDYASIRASLSRHFTVNHVCEGDTFAIVLAPEYFENPLAEDDQIFDASKPFRFQKETIVAWRDGKELTDAHVHGADPVPNYEKVEGVQHIYYFCALHNLQYDYGYLMFADDAYVIESDYLYSYMEKLEQSLMLFRSNQRLDMLNQDLKRIYDKDPMTGLYTRFVYENKVGPLYESCLRKKTSMTVMFVDINYMKRINDQFGHLQGDIAIRIVANAIRDNIHPEWIAVRFGGDEFLIIAPDTTEQTASALKEKLLGVLEENNNSSQRPYRITVSCAYVVTNPDSEKVLEDYVREADQLMYRIKQEVHARDGKPRY